MRRGALPVILAAAAAASVAMCGCFEPPPPAPTPRVDATLALLGEGACPKDIEVRLTNKDPAAIWVSNGGFTVLDASGNVLHQSPAATSYYPTTHFPENRSLGANESAQGHITFYPSVNNPPYTLRYAYDGVVGQVLLNAPPNGTDGCPRTPTASTSTPNPDHGKAATLRSTWRR